MPIVFPGVFDPSNIKARGAGATDQKPVNRAQQTGSGLGTANFGAMTGNVQDFTTASDSELMYNDPNTTFYNVPGASSWMNSAQLGNWYDDQKQDIYGSGYERVHDKPNTASPGQAPKQDAPAPQASQGSGQWAGSYRPMGYESWVPIRPTGSFTSNGSTFMPGGK